ncbi:hypothetical protein [Arenimonas composti]|uniref:DUF7832 domain-containing protein n=1 Tax=Arenimonas composti TR7-09 = DSM 18010 TaxID=1121013 RepID=A0A091B918_9GAMM|nr:hypothetical protein [Arenimonas composti]KFN48246.1 hypothetical protein P873_01430 [Arenimonas composti TR7-09 = DSM 18010]
MKYETDANSGFYLAWLILKNHAGERTAAFEDALRARSRSGRQVLNEDLGGVLDDDCFDGDGNLFTATYYADLFLADVRRAFAGDDKDADGAVADRWENHDRLAAMLDQRWKQWEAGHPFAPLMAPPSRSAPTLELSLEPLDDAAPSEGRASFAVGAAPPAGEPREILTASTQALLHGVPPLPDILVDKVRQALSRFLGFDGFAADAAARPLESTVLYALPLTAEFPGGRHWLELLSVDDRPSGARPGWGVSLRLRSRPDKAIAADAAVNAPGWQREADPEQPDQELFRLPLEQWWSEPEALARTGDGTAYVPVNHPNDLDAALENLRTQVQSKLRPSMRAFEIAVVRAGKG